jgi:hypothetical protein
MNGQRLGDNLHIWQFRDFVFVFCLRYGFKWLGMLLVCNMGTCLLTVAISLAKQNLCEQANAPADSRTGAFSVPRSLSRKEGWSLSS